MVFQYDHANLPHLVGLGLVSTFLDIQFLFYAFLAVQVMTSPGSFFETQPEQQFPKVVESNIRV